MYVFYFYFILIFKRGRLGRGNLGGIVGLAYASYVARGWSNIENV